MTGMALWFTADPLAREVEPTKIPGVTEQLMLATLVDSGVAVLWQQGNQRYPKWRTAVVLCGSSSSRSTVLDTTGELTALSTI